MSPSSPVFAYLCVSLWLLRIIPAERVTKWNLQPKEAWMFTVQQHIEYMAGYELDGQDRYVVIFEDPRPASITRFAPKTPGFVGKNVCLNATEYEVEEAKQRNSGNMPVAINTHMWRNESYYCSLFEKNERAVQWESYVNLTISEFNQTYKDVTSRGYWPTWVDIHIAATGGATGTDESELSALVADARRCGGIFQKIEKSEEDIITVAGVEESEWIGQDNSPHDALVSDGYSPIQISLAYDSLDFSTVYISAIYEKDDKKPGIDWVFERSLMGIYLDSTNRKHVTNGFRIKQAAPITLDYPEGALDEAHFYGLWEKDPALRVEGNLNSTNTSIILETPSPSEPPAPPPPSGLSSAVTIGISIGVTIVGMILVIILVVYLRRRFRKQPTPSAQPEESFNPLGGKPEMLADTKQPTELSGTTKTIIPSEMNGGTDLRELPGCLLEVERHELPAEELPYSGDARDM